MCSTEDYLVKEPAPFVFKEDTTSIEDSLNEEPDKNFSNGLITWEVESFSLITSVHKVIPSALIALRGPAETWWKMYLHIPPRKNRVLLKVEMLPNEYGISKVDLHWAFCLLDETEKDSFSAERIFSYEPKTVLTLEYLSLKRMLDIAQKKKYDNLTLKCRMLIDFGLKVKFPKPRVVGVEHLSNSLFNLPTSFLYHDTTPTVNNVEFSLHRAMLFLRGAKLVRFIEETSNVNNFSLSKTKAATAVFQYLYTGNLKLILDDPCLTILNYAEHSEIPELETIYAQQRIKVSSKVALKDHTITWKIPDFKNVTRTIPGPDFKIEDVKSRLQLSLNVKESKDDPPKKSLSVEVTLIESEMLLVLRVEFSFGKDEDAILFTVRDHGMVGPKDRLGVTLSENDFPEMKECFLYDTLFIKTDVYRSIGPVSSYIVDYQNLAPIKIPNQRSFTSLSKTLREMKETSIHSDFDFKVDDKVIKAHKFIVASRSPVMKELFRRHEGLSSVEVYGCTKEVFEKFLSYIYIGIITESDGDKLIELYHLGKKFNVEGLLKVVPRLLSKYINEGNIFRIMEFADDIEHNGLKQTTLDYVMCKGNTLLKHEDHDRFRSKKPDMYRQFQHILSLK